jgi:penicillin-binding protein 2
MKNNPFVIEENSRHIRDHKLNRFQPGAGGEIFNFDAVRLARGNSLNQRRVSVFFFFIFFLLLVFLTRFFYLQIVQGHYWYNIAEGNRLRLERQLAPRGILFDRDLKPLVSNEPNFILSYQPADFLSAEQKKELQNFLSATIPEAATADNQQKIETHVGPLTDPLVLLDNISYERALEIVVRLDAWPELKLSSFSRRKYLVANYGLATVLGYLGKISEQDWPALKKKGYQLIEWVGKSGLEKVYDEKLRGQPGLKELEVDVRGNVKRIIGQTEAKKGANLVLTLDAELNKIFAQTLCRHASAYGGKAAGLALDPRKGEILALVSCPQFDNNYFSDPLKNSAAITQLLQNEKQPLFNRVIQGEYPPGSTFKLMLAAAGLQEKIITAATTVFSQGGISIESWFFPDWKTGGHGVTDVIKAIAESVNTFFYYVGGGYEKFVGLGVDKIINYARQFYFGRTAGLDLPGEQIGFLPSRDWKFKTKDESWYIGDTYHLSIGQGDITVTPLQIAQLTTFFANGGTLYQPHLVKEFIDEKNQTMAVAAKTLVSGLIDPAHVALVRQGMRAAVTTGSAQILLSLPVKAAAKTGTAQVGGNQAPHAWFTSFAPFDQPEIVVTVLIENGVEGSVSAAPVVRDVLQFYFSNQ